MTVTSHQQQNSPRAALRLLAVKPAGLITDVDGTISRIVDDPRSASIEPRALAALVRLSRSIAQVALLSGRSVAQLRAMAPTRSLLLIGNHGLEWWEDGAAVVHPAARPFVGQIAEAGACIMEEGTAPGVTLENKRVGLAIHYRRAQDPRHARGRILGLLARCPGVRGLRLTEGRMVIELLPPVHVDKGTALERIILGRQLRAAVYMGDDTTDLDAFRTLIALREARRCAGLAVAVRSDEAPAELIEMADVVLDGVDEAALFLEMAASHVEAEAG